MIFNTFLNDCSIFLSQKDGMKELTWWVPLTYSDPENGFNNTYNKEWLSPQKLSNKFNNMPPTNKPVIFNVQQTGYYRFVHKLNSVLIFC